MLHKASGDWRLLFSLSAGGWDMLGCGIAVGSLDLCTPYSTSILVWTFTLTCTCTRCTVQYSKVLYSWILCIVQYLHELTCTCTSTRRNTQNIQYTVICRQKQIHCGFAISPKRSCVFRFLFGISPFRLPYTRCPSSILQMLMYLKHNYKYRYLWRIEGGWKTLRDQSVLSIASSELQLTTLLPYL